MSLALHGILSKMNKLQLQIGNFLHFLPFDISLCSTSGAWSGGPPSGLGQVLIVVAIFGICLVLWRLSTFRGSEFWQRWSVLV